MNNYCSLKEAWGIETFEKQKKKKKRRRKKKRETYKNYDHLEHEVAEESRPKPIEIEDMDELDGYNSSDYEQYAIEDEYEHQDLNTISNYTQEKQDDSVQYIESESYDDVSYEDQSYEAPQQHSDIDSVLMKMYDILERVEEKSMMGSNGNVYDLMLFMFLGVFILFVVDYMYKIGTRASNHL